MLFLVYSALLFLKLKSDHIAGGTGCSDAIQLNIIAERIRMTMSDYSGLYAVFKPGRSGLLEQIS
jgi:hypothetical protein